MVKKMKSRFDIPLTLPLTAQLAAFLIGYNISTVPYANTYYTTAVAYG